MPSAPIASSSTASASSTSSRSRIASIDAMPRSTLNGTLTVFCDSGSTTDLCTISPGVSSVPANALPSMTTSPPNSSASSMRAVALDAAVGNHRHVRPADRQPALDQRLHLRHAEAGRHPRRAAAARADADLDAVGAALDAGTRAPSAVATLPAISSTSAKALAELAPSPCSITTEWPCAMSITMTSTLGADQLRGPFEVVAGGADGGADPQPAVLVARRERQPPLAQQVARGDQADAACRPRRRAAAS